MPGAKKIELFARNNNLRHGWFSLGNQLGEMYQKWQVEINCNQCQANLMSGKARYKSRREANYDMCELCFKKMVEEKTIEENHFFQLANKPDEEVLH